MDPEDSIDKISYKFEVQFTKFILHLELRHYPSKKKHVKMCVSALLRWALLFIFLCLHPNCIWFVWFIFCKIICKVAGIIEVTYF